MKDRSIGTYAAVTVVVIGMAFAYLWSPATAQAPAGRPAGYVPPPAGQPDLQGVWRVWNLAQYDVEDHGARPGIPAGRGVIVDPPDGRIPYRPDALAKRAENYRNSRDHDPWKSADPLDKCYKPGVPRITYLGWPFQIVQTDKYVAFIYEWMHERRYAYYDFKGRDPDAEWWNGDSRAKWEGNTLVIDVTDFNDRTWFDKVGNYHSDALHVVERYTLIDQNTLDYEVTLEDPKVFTRPWKMKMPIRRQTDVGLLDYECHALLDEAGYPITWPRE
jgi:hypothetical protein